MKRAAWLLLLFAVACKTTSTAKRFEPLPTATPAEDARQRARGLKDDGVAAVVAWIEGNDRKYARERLDAGIEKAPNKAHLRIARAVLSLSELDEVAAWRDLAHVIEAAPDSAEAELAMVLIADRVRATRDAEVLSAALAKTMEAGRAERVVIASAISARIASGLNKDDDAKKAMARAGKLVDWRGIGPIAPLDHREMAERPRYVDSSDWSNPEPFRGAIPSIDSYGHTRRGHLRPKGSPGLYVFETFVELDEAGALLLDARLPTTSRIEIDGQLVVDHDLGDRQRPHRVRVPLRAGAGWHRVTLTMLGSPSHRVSIGLLAADGAPVVKQQAEALPKGAALVSVAPAVGQRAVDADMPIDAPDLVAKWIRSDDWSWFGRTMAAFVHLSGWYRDLESARAVLFGVDVAAPESAALHLAHGRLLRWTNRPSGMVQASVAEALELDPTHPAALVALAAAIQSDDADRALALVERAEKAAPHSLRPDVLRLRIYRERGWRAEAVELLRAIVKRDPPQSVLRDGAQFLRSLDYVEEANTLLARADAMTKDEVSIDAKLMRGQIDEAIAQLIEDGGPNNFARAARLLLTRGERDEAKKRADAAIERDPGHVGALEVRLRIAVLEEDAEAAKRIVAALRTQGSASISHEVLRSLVSGETLARPEAGSWLAKELKHDVWPQIRYLPGTDVPRGLDPADPNSRYASVRLLDRVVDHVRPNGQALSWRHEVTRLQTKEATDKAGEFRIPGDALPVTLRTLKPDGRMLDVDQHSGKNDLSFSALAPGDAVERDWVDVTSPATAWGGYMRRFYFSGTTPTERSDYVVVVPKGLKVWTHSYHGAPEPIVQDEGDHTIYLFTARDIEAFQPEPASAPWEEFVPFVAVAVEADHDRALAANTLGLDALTRTAYDVEATAHRIIKGVPEAEHVRAIFQWVTREIGDGRAREPSVVLATKRGDRAGIFAAMLRAIGVPAEVVLAESGGNLRISPRFPMTSRFEMGLVRITPKDQPTEWAFLEGKQPWLGRLPPFMRDGAYVSWSDASVHPIRAREVDTWKLVSHVELEVDAAGNAAGKVQLTLPGTYGAQLREFLLGAREEQAQRQLQGWLSSLIPGARLVDFETVNADTPSLPYGLEARVAIDAFMVREGNMLVNEQFFWSLLASRSIGMPSLGTYLRTPARKSPMFIRENAEQMTVVVRFPSNTSQPLEAPQSFTRGMDFGQFSQAFEWDAEKHEARLVRIEAMPQMRLPAEAFGPFRVSAQEILQALRNRLVVPVDVMAQLSAKR
ncbi:MAG: hypothetical protein RL846_42370 [Deltaproteobacteria bacterium]